MRVDLFPGEFQIDGIVHLRPRKPAGLGKADDHAPGSEFTNNVIKVLIHPAGRDLPIGIVKQYFPSFLPDALHRATTQFLHIPVEGQSRKLYALTHG